MKRKTKRFNGEDGSEIREGKEHSGISDETRERARRFVESGGKRDEEEVTSESSTSRSVKSTPKAAPKATPKRDETPISTQYGRGVRSDYVERPAKRESVTRLDSTVPSAKSAPSAEPSRMDRIRAGIRNAFPGNSPLDSLGAAGPGISAVGRGVGRLLGGIGGAGRAEKAAERGDSVWRAAGERAAATRREGAAKAENLREKLEAAKEASEIARIARRAPRNVEESTMAGEGGPHFKKGGKVSASKRADGIAKRGKTRGMLR